MIDSGYASSSSSPTSPTLPAFGARSRFPSHPSHKGEDDESINGNVRVDKEIRLKDATRAFFGGMNNHSAAAREMMRCLRVAKLATNLDSTGRDGVAGKEKGGMIKGE